MTDKQKLRNAQLRARADRALAVEVPNPAARDFLLDTIKDTPSGRAHILSNGQAPGDAELLVEIWATENGRNIREMLTKADAEANSKESDQAAEIESINKIVNPVERINAARKAGLL